MFLPQREALAYVSTNSPVSARAAPNPPRRSTHLHVFHKPLEERDKVFGLAYIPRNRFLDHIVREHYKQDQQRKQRGEERRQHVPGFAITSSSSLDSFASCSPATSCAYSSCNLPASVRLILPHKHQHPCLCSATDEGTYSSIFSESLTTLRAAESSIGLVRSIDSDSRHTLSARRISLEIGDMGRGETYRCYGLRQRRRYCPCSFPWIPGLRSWGRGGSGRSR